MNEYCHIELFLMTTCNYWLLTFAFQGSKGNRKLLSLHESSWKSQISAFLQICCLSRIHPCIRFLFFSTITRLSGCLKDSCRSLRLIGSCRGKTKRTYSHKEEGWFLKLFVGWPHWQPGCAGLQLITFYMELKVAVHMNWRSQSFYSKDSKIVSKGLKPYLFLISWLLRTVNRFLERKYSNVIQRDYVSSHLLWDHVEAARYTYVFSRHPGKWNTKFQALS